MVTSNSALRTTLLAVLFAAGLAVLPYTASATSGVDEDSAPVTQCSDNIDNDGDGLMDAEDADCEGAWDDQESNDFGITVEDQNTDIEVYFCTAEGHAKK